MVVVLRQGKGLVTALQYLPWQSVLAIAEGWSAIGGWLYCMHEP